MRFLKKVLLSLALILLLAGAKTLCLKYAPVSNVFFYNLFSALQLAVLGWALFTGTLESFCWKKKAPRSAAQKSLSVYISLLVVLEMASVWLIHHPSRIPKRMLPVFSTYYEAYQRNILQFDPSITRYDTGLFYRLHPNNTAVFKNIEFADTIRTDSSSFRNDDDPGKPPSVICLGDSYTLGWGVRQQEAWPQQLSALSHLPVLNTGMASYGTAREVRSLRGLDLQNIQYIIIQYCYNDLDENEAYVRDGYSLHLSDCNAWTDACRELEWSKRYFPGKIFFTLAKMSLRPPAATTADAAQIRTRHVPAFLEVLKHSGWDFNRVHVIVFDIGPFGDMNSSFSRTLQTQLTTPENRLLFKDHVHLLPVYSLLDRSDYYLLDTHIRASGHQKIALALSQLIGRLSSPPIDPSSPPIRGEQTIQHRH